MKEELAQRSKDLADAEAHHNQELLSVRAALQQAEQQRDELEKKLAAARRPNAAAAARRSQQSAGWPSRWNNSRPASAVLEASPVPYTRRGDWPFEKISPAPSVRERQAAAAQSIPTMFIRSKICRRARAPLWDEAMRASMAGDYDTAEQKYNEVLQQDRDQCLCAGLSGQRAIRRRPSWPSARKTVQRALAV